MILLPFRKNYPFYILIIPIIIIIVSFSHDIFFAVAEEIIKENSRAIDTYKQAVRINPDDAEAHYNLGVAYGDSGMYKEAIEEYKQAIRINPDYAEAHHDLGVIYGDFGMHKEAIEAFKQAIRIKPDYVEAHYNLGTIYLFLNDRDSASVEYKILKDLNPEVAEIFSIYFYK